MAGSVNKVILVGNLGRDPEVKSMQDGRSLVNMSVATSETWRDRNSGERKERTEWHRVVIFNDKLAEVAQKFLKKAVCRAVVAAAGGVDALPRAARPSSTTTFRSRP